MTQLTRVSTKGQVVIPTRIRKELRLEAGATLAVSRMQNMVILKKLDLPDPKQEFHRLTARGRLRARQLGIRSEADVVRIIHERRKKDKSGP